MCTTVAVCKQRFAASVRVMMRVLASHGMFCFDRHARTAAAHDAVQVWLVTPFLYVSCFVLEVAVGAP
jgi:hypothetical protein